MGSVRFALRAGCVFVFLCSVVVPCVLLILANSSDDLAIARLSELDVARGHERKHRRKPLDFAGEKSMEELRFQIRELEQIRTSVRNELRVMEEYRSRLAREISSHQEKLTWLKQEVGAARVELQDARLKVIKAEQESISEPRDIHTSVAKQAPIVILQPRQWSPKLLPEHHSEEGHFVRCVFSHCFDFSRCPLVQPFRAFIYNMAHPDLFKLTHPLWVKTFSEYLKSTGSVTDDGNQACVFIVILDNSDQISADGMKNRLQSLPHWGSDGVNHLLIELSSEASILDDVPIGQAVVARSWLSLSKQLRTGYDLLIPPVRSSLLYDEPSLIEVPPHIPTYRENLIFFQGNYIADDSSQGSCITKEDLVTLRNTLKNEGQESVVIITDCESDKNSKAVGGEWGLCATEKERLMLCSKSTFALVVGSCGSKTGRDTFLRLSEALHCGAIPIVIGIDQLPYNSVIDWYQTAVILPLLRFSEIHYIIRSFDENTLLAYRRQGQFLWDTYFSSALQILKSTIAILRSRTLHPPPPSPDYVETELVKLQGSQKMAPALLFQFNFTVYTSDFWNSPPGPFFMYPLTPFKPSPVSGTKYVNMDDSAIQRLPTHIIQAGGITGPYFEHYLLGNRPEEQFTAVLLTYQRNDILIQALERLKDVSYLAKIVVVWNNEEDPPSDLQWPDVGVTVEVVRGPKNSLNNRFLPFSAIETEAVLSIDDDVHLRHDEIQFGFRVWREARDRIVGFPGRFHSWDVRHNGWLYNSNYTCELSMVLTGAAFFHKFYSYVYSYWMPAEIRAIVDHYMNCEDIAMNFLVSHITRKPPLKATTRWTFVCPTCPKSLSYSDSHFNERHICMNRFTEIFGYMPLLFTQFRVDSVLFKTRLPSDLEKCYQFI